jgi:excisionase family DNA binding protein
MVSMKPKSIETFSPLWQEMTQQSSASGRVFFENLLDKKQLAESLGLSRSYISKLMTFESLPYVKIGRAVRFRQSEVLAWLQHRRKP